MFEKLIHLEGIDPLEFFGVNNAKMNFSYIVTVIINDAYNLIRFNRP